MVLTGCVCSGNTCSLPVSCVACIEPDPVKPQAEEPANHWAHGFASCQQQLKEQGAAPGLQSMQAPSDRQLCILTFGQKTQGPFLFQALSSTQGG